MNDIFDCLVKIIVSPISINWFCPFITINKKHTMGTGIAIEANDKYVYILTCAHVVEDNAKISVITRNSREKIRASVVGISFDKDVAIIKIKKSCANNLKIMKIDENVNVIQGSTLRAVGYPRAEENPILTRGVFSGYRKNDLQVDTPVNPGNSGGPLIDDNDNIVAIVTSKVPNNVAANVAFGIPIKLIINIKNDLMALDNKKTKIISEPKLGMSYIQMDSSFLAYLKDIANLNILSGCLVKYIHRNSPVYEKINVGSILIKIDNNDIDKFGYVYKTTNDNNSYKLHITDFVSSKRNGDKISIVFYNKLSETEYVYSDISIVLTSYDYNIKKLYYPYNNPDYEIFGGMIFMKLTENHIFDSSGNVSSTNDYLMTKYLQHDYRDSNVLFVSTILQGSRISDIGLFDNGEIITHVNDVPISESIEKISILDNFREIIKNSITKSKYIKLTSLTNKFVVLNVNETLDEEIKMAEYHKYKMTNFTTELLKFYGKTNVIEPLISKQNYSHHTVDNMILLNGGNSKACNNKQNINFSLKGKFCDSDITVKKFVDNLKNNMTHTNEVGF